MGAGLFLLVTISALLLVLAGFHLKKKMKLARRKHLRQQPLTKDQLHLLENNVPLYSRLPDELQADLISNMQVFLDEKEFYGRAGLEITEEVRITVAGNACMLLLNRSNNCFPGFKTILIYPGTYRAMHSHREGHLVSEHMSHRAGESWHRGPVILAWDNVLFGSRTLGDGFNVVLHEFAHKLDEENSIVDGAPKLASSEDYREWARVFCKDYHQFVQEIEQHPDHAIDDYGATSPPEFFAVCTESYFEKPQLLKEFWPDLYQQMKNYYQVDPGAW